MVWMPVGCEGGYFKGTLMNLPVKKANKCQMIL